MARILQGARHRAPQWMQAKWHSVCMPSIEHHVPGSMSLQEDPPHPRGQPAYSVLVALKFLWDRNATHTAKQGATQNARNQLHWQTPAHRRRTERRGGAGYSSRDAQERFTSDQVEVGHSLTADRRQKAKHHAPKGHKDRGDRIDASQQSVDEPRG